MNYHYKTRFKFCLSPYPLLILTRTPFNNLSCRYENIIIIGDPSETDMSDRRPRHASLEMDMPHRRPTFLIGDRHTPNKTDMPEEIHRRPTCLRSPIGIYHIYILIYLFLHTFWLFIYIGIM